MDSNSFFNFFKKIIQICIANGWLRIPAPRHGYYHEAFRLSKDQKLVGLQSWEYPVIYSNQSPLEIVLIQFLEKMSVQMYEHIHNLLYL